MTANSKKLVDLIKAGKLKETNANAGKVKMAWCRELRWEQVFSGPILGDLPDPEETGKYREILEEWLVAAFSRGRDETEVRQALDKVRRTIQEDEIERENASEEIE